MGSNAESLLAKSFVMTYVGAHHDGNGEDEPFAGEFDPDAHDLAGEVQFAIVPYEPRPERSLS